MALIKFARNLYPLCKRRQLKAPSHNPTMPPCRHLPDQCAKTVHHQFLSPKAGFPPFPKLRIIRHGRLEKPPGTIHCSADILHFHAAPVNLLLDDSIVLQGSSSCPSCVSFVSEEQVQSPFGDSGSGASMRNLRLKITHRSIG